MARLAAAALAAALTCCGFAASAAARPGDVDSTFGNGGERLYDPADVASELEGLALGPGGRFLVSAWAHPDAGAHRFEADGALDRDFGNDGWVDAPSTRNPPVVQPDGSVILTWGRTVQRFLSSGEPDPDFGTGGAYDAGEYGNIDDAALQTDGKLVLAASGRGGPGDGLEVRRLLRDGTPDADFGDGGRASTAFAGEYTTARAVVVQPDGKPVVAAETGTAHDYRWVVLRYTETGALDPDFGTGGIATLFRGGASTPWDLVIQPDGKLVVAGAYQPDSPGNVMTAAARLRSDGTPDPDFGDAGRALVGPDSQGNMPSAWPLYLTLQDNGRIVLGMFGTWQLGRLLPDGRLDPDFGDGGFAATGANTVTVGVVEDAAGRLVVAGTALDECGGRRAFLARFHGEDGGSGALGPAPRACWHDVEVPPDGVADVGVQCPHVEDLCEGTGSIELPQATGNASRLAAPKAVTVGTRKLRLRGGRHRKVAIALSKAGRTTVRQRGRVRATLVFRVHDGQGHSRTTRRRITLHAG